MSYEWIRRRKRYLSFRYLFPEFVAPWIQFKRGLLRMMWFFTHPVDEFFEDLGELIAWPFVALATFFAWILSGIGEFFKDLFEGVEAFFNYIGRLPVWTGAAIAGTLGIIMTILLFFLQVATFEPVPLSTAVAIGEPRTEMPAPAPQTLITQPQPSAVPGFDPFGGQASPQPSVWSPSLDQQPVSGLVIGIDRLSGPFGWNAQQRIDVVSTSTPARSQTGWSHFERISAMNGWSRTQIQRAQALLNFTPYVSRQNVRNSQIAPSWVTAAASVSPYSPVANSRQPSVSITRTMPTSASLGGSMRYELVVSNVGVEPLDSVTVHETVSAIDRVMDVDPPANVIDNTLVWNVTNLQPRQQRRIAIELRPDQLIPVSGGSTVRVKTGVAAVSRVTEPTQPAPPITPEPREDLNVFNLQPRPKPALRPEPPAQDIGMILPSFDDEPKPLPEPPPQQSEPAFTFEPFPQKPPKPAPAILPVEHEDPDPVITNFEPMRKTETTNSTSGVPIFFEMRTPTIVAVEGAVATVFEIRNPGSADLTELVILVEVTGQLDHERGRILEHRIERLAPGGVYRTRLTTTAVRDGLAHVRSTLTSAEDLESTLEAEIEVSRPEPSATQLSEADTPPQGWPMFTQ